MKVLLAIDDSECSEDAVKAISEQVRPESTEVCVLHVVPQTQPVQSVRQGRELVARVEQVLSKSGFKVETAIEGGDPREAVTDYAARWKADLIVVGSHSRKGMERFIMGSVAEAILRRSPCSVEVVRTRAS